MKALGSFPEGRQRSLSLALKDRSVGWLICFRLSPVGLVEPWHAVGTIFYWISISGRHQFSSSLLDGAGAAE